MPLNTFHTAAQAFHKHVALHSLAHYTGILSLQGYAHLALTTGNLSVLDECRSHLLPFIRGERYSFKANFTNYYCGGNGAALLYMHSKLPEARDVLRRAADETLQKAPRDDQGIFCMPNSTQQKIWIDVAFAVTPFLLFCGLAFHEDAYIEEAFQQTFKMVEILRNPENELLHQARGFTAPGVISQDHWSRGNGWGILAMAELVKFLDDHDPRRPAAEEMFTRLAMACLKFQDAQGLWHQEMTDFNSYVETSGTGLILYALGTGIERGILKDVPMSSYLKGLRGYSQYIQPDGTVFHTCKGNLNPGKGTIIDYKQTPPVVNDPHAFGPVVLAYTQALEMGITELVG